MEGFKAAYLNEMDKLLKKKKIFAAAIIAVISVVIGQLAVTFINSGFGIRFTGGTGFPIALLSVFEYTILPLFTAFVCIDMFCTEFASNTMKITLTRPVSRLAVFSSKVSCIATFILANLIFMMIISTVTGLVFNAHTGGFGRLVKIFLSYIVTFFPVFALALMVVFLSNMFRGGLLVFFISIIIFLALNFLSIFYSRYSSFFITSSLDWYNQWISDKPDIFKMLRQFLILAGCSIMFYTAGYYLFEKKDL